MLSIFCMFINHLYAFFREISVYILWPLFLGVVCVSGIELHELLINKLINKDINSLSVVLFAVISSYFEVCLFTLFLVPFIVQNF